MAMNFNIPDISETGGQGRDRGKEEKDEKDRRTPARRLA